LVLTESQLFVVSDKGTIKSQRRFNFVPSGIHIYHGYSQKRIKDPETQKMVAPINCIISSFTHHLMIYEEFNLMWAAKYF
jgi:hypothetical protein